MGFPKKVDKLRLLFFLIDPGMQYFRHRKDLMTQHKRLTESSNLKMSRVGLPSVYVAPPSLAASVARSHLGEKGVKSRTAGPFSPNNQAPLRSVSFAPSSNTSSRLDVSVDEFESMLAVNGDKHREEGRSMGR